MLLAICKKSQILGEELLLLTDILSLNLFICLPVSVGQSSNHSVRQSISQSGSRSQANKSVSKSVS